MSESQNISFDQLKALAEGKLSAKEAEALQQKIKGHPKWEPIYKGLLQFQENEAEPVEVFINKHKLRIKSTPPKKKNSAFYYWSISAAAAVVFAVLLFSKPWQSDYSEIDFHDAGLPITLSTNENSTFNQGILAFKQEQYEQALALFKQTQKNKIGTDTLLYFKATCQKQLGKHKQAIILYRKIKPNSAYFEKAEYQSAISYVFQGETEKAISMLKSISKSEKHTFSKQAKKALETLEQS